MILVWAPTLTFTTEGTIWKFIPKQIRSSKSVSLKRWPTTSWTCTQILFADCIVSISNPFRKHIEQIVCCPHFWYQLGTSTLWLTTLLKTASNFIVNSSSTNMTTILGGLKQKLSTFHLFMIILEVILHPHIPDFRGSNNCSLHGMLILHKYILWWHI